MNTPEETPLDIGEIEKALHANRLGGMPDMVKLLIAENQLNTFEQLQAALVDPENYNKFGKFEISTTYVSRALNIMGHNFKDTDPPKNYALVVNEKIIPEMLPVIEIAQEKTKEKRGQDDEDEIIDKKKPEKILAA